ncbi:MAG: hypothetical protein ABS70_05660 [Nitrospira sp. SCN 59-13]|nr:MAG: hypothetical protein ABS70_05660 [Nitrospira sp. SCN 59-13]
MRSDKKPPLKSDKKVLPKVQKKGSLGYNKKSALLEDAITQMNAGKYGRASSALKDLLALDPLNAEARRLFATLHLRLGSLMSARTAFESLAREAMERQDYWLAESLLREYLTAGPRYVPFLEMLGRVYEEKGDVMAAAAEYGKAVEVLLEDPDSEKPNHPSELFARIRSIAPGSPVSFRLAAMFDTVTGQVLQATPQPAASAQEQESPQAEVVEAPASGVAPMPWEQMEPLQADMPVAQGTSSPSEAPLTTAVVEPAMPAALPVEAVAAIEPQKPEVDQSPTRETSEMPTTLTPVESVASSLSPVGSSEGPMKGAAESEPPAIDPLPAPTSEAALAPPVTLETPPANVSLVEVAADPIAHAPSSPAPMPWDQVEEVAVVIPPASATQESTVSDEVIPGTPEPEVGPSVDVEAVLPSMEGLEESGNQTIASTPAPLPLIQVAEEAIAIPPAASQASAEPESSTSLISETEAPSSPTSDPVPHAIEVLSQSGSHPIVATPTTPVSMPWDQVEENPIHIPPAAAPLAASVEEVVPESCEEKPLPSVIETGNTGIESPTRQEEAQTATAASTSSSEITSSGLSWDEILAAVAAMQSSPASPQSLPSVDPTQVTERAVTEEPVAAATGNADAAETTAVSSDDPSSELPPLDPGNASSTLSAPMPWEQVEVEDVTIPRPEPEPEFGSAPVAVEASGNSSGMTLDSTLVLPASPETPEAVAQVETPTVAAEPSTDSVEESGRGLRLLSSDEQETHDSPLHHPAEPYEATLPEESPTLSDPEPTVGLAKEDSAAIPLRLVESESIPSQPLVEPSHVHAEPITEFTLAGSRAESIEPASEPVLQVEHSQEVIGEPEAMTPSEPAPVDETVAAPIALSSIEDQTLSVAEPIALEAQDNMPAELSSAESEPAPVLSLEPGAKSDEQAVVDSLASAAEVSLPELTDVQPALAEEFLPEASPELSAVVPTEEAIELVQIPQAPESVQVDPPVEMAPSQAPALEEEVPASAAPAPSEVPASDGLHILWEDASSAPTPKPSTGNMLTRWLKKPAEPVASEASAVPPAIPIPSEPVAPVAIEAVKESVPAALVTEQPYEPIEQAPAAIAEEPPHRPTRIQPAGPGLLSRVGEAAASLVGAGVSTTRSLVVLILALVGLVLFVIGGAIAAVAVTWLILEEQPNAAYRTMTSVPQQTLQDSSKNGYLLLLGLGAAASQDPVQVGIDRRVEGADRAFTHTCLTGEGYAPDGGFSASAEAAGKWMKAADPAMQMQMDVSGAKAWLSQAEVSLSRYRQWLNKPFEDVGYGQSISPNCGLILQTHRLYLAEGFAQDADTGFGRLETDLTAWRTVLGQAKSLPVKMLASAAMNDDVMVMSGLLQRPDLDERYVSRMAKLAKPLEPSEQSLRWPMQSQFVLATKTLDEAVSQNRADTRPFYGAIAAAMPLPKQRRFNAYAEYYDAVGKAAAEGRYTDLPKLSQFVRVAPYSVSDMVMNPIEGLVGVDPMPTWETYAGRVLETDARLRLVSLQAWLRRTPPEQDLLTRLAKAGQGLYDPFTGLPMLVNMKKGVLYSVGQDLKDNEAHERLDLVAQIPSVAWAGKKSHDAGKTK